MLLKPNKNFHLNVVQALAPWFSVLILSGCGERPIKPGTTPPNSVLSPQSEHTISAPTEPTLEHKTAAEAPILESKTTAQVPTLEHKTTAQASAIEPKTTPQAAALHLNTPIGAPILPDLGQKLLQYKLDKLPNSMVICTVNNVPITFGDYRREFRIDQQQVQASVSYNSRLAGGLLQAAHKQNIALTDNERELLLKSSNKMQAGGTKSFNKMLKDNSIDKKQFDKEILDMGLAFKTANIMIEGNLLNGLINRVLLLEAAKADGFSKEAMNTYNEAIKSPGYKKMLDTGAFTADDLRTEIINNELCSKESEKIKTASPLNDIELNDFYEQNRGKFRHGNRVRLSQIVVVIPAKPEGQKENYRIAQGYLGRAVQGENFANLANQYSQDPHKTDGGDLGFQEEAKFPKDFVSKSSKLPVGAVIPEIVFSPQGYHIFKITARDKAGYYPLAEVKDQLKAMLGQQKGKEVLNNWLANQRQKAVIAISPELNSLLANNKLEKREETKHRLPTTQISGQDVHF